MQLFHLTQILVFQLFDLPVLGLAGGHGRNLKRLSRYVRVISPDIPSKTIAWLHTVGQGCRVPLLEVKSISRKHFKKIQRLEVLHLFRCHHAHTRFLHTDPFTHRRLPRHTWNRNFTSVFAHRTSFRAKMVAAHPGARWEPGPPSLRPVGRGSAAKSWLASPGWRLKGRGLQLFRRRLATQTGQLADPPAEKGGLEGAPVDSFACLFRRACVLVAICNVRCLGLKRRCWRWSCLSCSPR